jgi:hypothetical protein
MSTVIEVQAIRPPREPRKPGHVIDADGASFEAWPEKLAKFQVGHRYAVELEVREWQGRPIRKIVKAQPFEGLNQQSVKPAHGPVLSTKTTTVAAATTAEHAFVGSIVSAFITAGKVDLD